MNVKKGLISGVGALMLLGGIYQIQSAYAAENPQTVEAKSAERPAMKKLETLEKYQDQIHQFNQLREERFDLKKQMIDKKDQLVDLYLAAKNSDNKEDLMRVKEIKKQLKASNGELKNLLVEAKAKRKTLNAAMKTGDASEPFNQLITTHKQIIEIMKERLSELDKAIGILK